MTFYSEVIEDFKQLYEDRENADVIIYAGEELKEFRAHSQVLLTRSSYFRGGILSHECANNQGVYFVFKKPNITSFTFEVILKFIYIGFINRNELNNANVSEILVAADELGVHKLIIYLRKFLITHTDNFLRRDPAKILYAIANHEIFEDLKEICMEPIFTDPNILFGSENFLTLKESTWMLILKSEKFIVDEIQIWDYVIKWGVAQDPKIKNNVKDFEDQDFETLGKRLCNFIPLIRFHEISMANFYLRVWPFERILSKELVDDMLHYYMVSDAKPRFDLSSPRISSILLKKGHVILFANWIDATDEYERLYQVPYSLRLLYRASRDGNKANNFHQKCDNQGATIVVAKVKDSETLVGGYNPLNWSRDGYKYTTKSFIYSIKDLNSNSGFTLGRLEGYPSNAIYNNSALGPAFGKDEDLCCRFKSWSSNQGTSRNSYENIHLPNKFDVSDWEVFKVAMKN
ncbi:12867_t:CDS:2 [Acaulospora morrowiae]|uniref:12867_t:CDS:1 n=1 Tax=Acaulospora morrowiae TaxID=94023 RepID=A0A9N9ALL0_9GLOM|nr:12867_t:CDS:2 [Acaulospora morrowiae]